MKKILALILALVLGQVAVAEDCYTSFTPQFTPQQAQILCTTVGQSFSTPGASITYTFGDDANRKIALGASSDTVDYIAFGDSGTTALQTMAIRGTTSNANDDSQLCLSGGGACGTVGRGAYITINGTEFTGGGDVAILSGDAEGDDIVFGNGGASGVIQFQPGGTGHWDMIADGTLRSNTGGVSLRYAAYVPTMVATPVVGTNLMKPGLVVVPTAAANTAAYLGASTPVPGESFKIFNNSGAAVRVKGSGAATLNGGSAGTWIGMAAASYMECQTVTTGVQICPFYSVNGAVAAAPTPAGP